MGAHTPATDPPRETLAPASATSAGTVRVSGEPLSGPRAFTYAANRPTPVLQYMATIAMAPQTGRVHSDNRAKHPYGTYYVSGGS